MKKVVGLSRSKDWNLIASLIFQILELTKRLSSIQPILEFSNLGAVVAYSNPTSRAITVKRRKSLFSA